MKKVISLVLSVILIMVGAYNGFASDVSADGESIEPDYASLNDPQLLEDVENNLYEQITKQLEGQDYYVENVSAVYISKEYIQELEYNSEMNVYFGYTLE